MANHLGSVCVFPSAPMKTSGGIMTGMAYVPPMEPMLERVKVPPFRSDSPSLPLRPRSDSLISKFKK